MSLGFQIRYQNGLIVILSVGKLKNVLFNIRNESLLHNSQTWDILCIKKSLIDSTYLFFSLHNLSPSKNKITYFQCYHVFLRGPEESTNHGYSYRFWFKIWMEKSYSFHNCSLQFSAKPSKTRIFNLGTTIWQEKFLLK